MGTLYGIFRVNKQKTVGGGLEAENNRAASMAGRVKFPNSDIDWQRTHRNVFLKRTDDWEDFIDREIVSRLGGPPRKNAVRALEGFYGASPAWFEGKSSSEIMEYFRDCLAFHEHHYGEVVNAVVHLDEATPHMHVISIPFTRDGRLSAFELVGGKDDLSRAQDMFHDEVSVRYGLARGEIHEDGAARKHMSVAQYKMQQEQQKAEAAAQEAARQQAHLDEVLRDIDTKNDIETRVLKAVKSVSKKSSFGGLIHDNNVVEMPRESFHDLRAAASCGASAMATVRTSEEQKQAAEQRADAAHAGLEIARSDVAVADARRKRVEQEAAPYLQIPEAARHIADMAIEQARQLWLTLWETTARCMAAAVIRGEKPRAVGADYKALTDALDMPTGRSYAKAAAKSMLDQSRGNAPRERSGSGWSVPADAVDYRKPVDELSVIDAVLGQGIAPVRMQSDADAHDALLADWDMLDELTKDAIKNKRDLRDL